MSKRSQTPESAGEAVQNALRNATKSMIEERRKMAERKMDLTRQNLLRGADIVSEIDRNRASLKRQVAKAEARRLAALVAVARDKALLTDR